MEILIVIVLVVLVFVLRPQKSNQGSLASSAIEPDMGQEQQQTEYISTEDDAKITAQEELAEREAKLARTERELDYLQGELDERASRLSQNEVETNTTQQQLENILNTLHLLDNNKPDKLDTIKKTNIQKCIQWCIKYKLPYNKSIQQLNIFLN